MKYKSGDFLECDKDHKYCVIGSGEEAGYEFYILKDIESKNEQTLLVSFVDSKMKRIDMNALKKWFLYFILIIFTKGDQ